jgi:hypothetical protein
MRTIIRKTSQLVQQIAIGRSKEVVSLDSATHIGKWKILQLQQFSSLTLSTRSNKSAYTYILIDVFWFVKYGHVFWTWWFFFDPEIHAGKEVDTQHRNGEESGDLEDSRAKVKHSIVLHNTAKEETKLLS